MILDTMLFFCWCVSISLQAKLIMFSFPSNFLSEKTVIEYFMLAVLSWQRMQVKHFLYFCCFGIWQHKMASFTHMHSIIRGYKTLNITKVNKYCISLHPAAFSFSLIYITSSSALYLVTTALIAEWNINSLVRDMQKILKGQGPKFIKGDFFFVFCLEWLVFQCC